MIIQLIYEDFLLTKKVRYFSMVVEHCDSCHNASLVQKPNKKIVVKKPSFYNHNVEKGGVVQFARLIFGKIS